MVTNSLLGNISLLRKQASGSIFNKWGGLSQQHKQHVKAQQKAENTFKKQKRKNKTLNA